MQIYVLQKTIHQFKTEKQLDTYKQNHYDLLKIEKNRKLVIGLKELMYIELNG